MAQRDLVGRFGGEEFIVFVEALPTGDAGRVELAAVAERLRREIARLAVPAACGGGMINGLTASVGAACYPADGADLDQVLRAADACLYAAKRAGRNLVRVAGVAQVPAPRAAGDVLGVSVEL